MSDLPTVKRLEVCDRLPEVTLQKLKDLLADWTDNRLRKHGPEAVRQYQLEKNMTSIDYLPGLEPVSLEHETL